MIRVRKSCGIKTLKRICFCVMILACGATAVPFTCAAAGDGVFAPGASRYSAIVNPAYLHREKFYGRMENSIRGLLVYQFSNGRLAGNSEEIIATVNPEQKTPPIKFVNKVGPDVMVAAKIALRAVRLRYPEIQPGCIRLSFSDQYTAVDGNSAGCAFAVLMLSLLENTRLDRSMAVTGAVTADWRIRAIGGLAAKIPGAISDHLTGVVVPQSNSRNVCDVMLLNGPQTAWQIQIFAARTLQQAMALMRRNKPRAISYAMLLFSTLQPTFAKEGKSALRDPAVIQRLKQIVALAPDDLSAQYLLELAKGTEPTKLSIGASMYEAFAAIHFYNDYLWKTTLPKTPPFPIRDSLRRLNRLRSIASVRCLPLIEALARFVRACGTWGGTANGAAHIVQRAQGVDRVLDRMHSNKQTIYRMMNSGF
jgi:hypothetical protein